MIDFLHEERPHFRTRWLGWMMKRNVEVSERKWRLFYCAVVGRIAHLLPVEEARRLIDVVEAHADGRADETGVKDAVAASMSACDADRTRRRQEGPGWSWVEHSAVGAISRFHREAPEHSLRPCAEAWAAAPAAAHRVCGTMHDWKVQNDADWQDKVKAETARQAALLREVVGNPFRVSVAEATWLTWNDATVRRLGEAIYDEKRWEDVPILADALQDAGCCDEAILGHFRGDGPHVRGCWAVDLILGRK
jgi:hypothetical protein